MFIANPPIYNFDDIFFAIPFPPIGFLFFLKPGYKIKSFCEEEKYEFTFIKSTKIIYDNKGYCSLKSVFDYDESKIKLDNITFWFSYFLLALLFTNYGFNKGEIYFIGNENSIELFMEVLRSNNFFQKRKDYVNNTDNYKNNTFFVVTKEEDKF